MLSMRVDLKFRLVMRDTATPKQKKRPSADKQASASGANATSDTTVLEKLRTENADLQARNTELAANQRVGAVRNISPHDFENELERLNSLNCNLLAKVAALTHELNQTRHQHHQQGSWNSTQDQVEPHVHVRVNRGANPMGGAAMTPLDYQPARPAYLDEAPTKNALADNGGTLLPANPLDGAPRFITRQRSSDGGKTRRKLNAPPQAVHLPSLNMSLDGSNSNKRV